jgi:hypothetical protein
MLRSFQVGAVTHRTPVLLKLPGCLGPVTDGMWQLKNRRLHVAAHLNLRNQFALARFGKK